MFISVLIVMDVDVLIVTFKLILKNICICVMDIRARG